MRFGQRFRQSLRAKVMSLTAEEARELDDIICKLRDGQPVVVQPQHRLNEYERHVLARFSFRVAEMKNFKP